MSSSPTQPMGIFPKGPTGEAGVFPHISPNPAQLSVLQSQTHKGGRFLLGLMMFLIGFVLGGILMNAYMKNYLNAASFNGVFEKGMSLVGLGTPSVPQVSTLGAASSASVQ